MDTPTYLTAAHSIALPADGSVPEWVHLLPAGEFVGRDGRGPYKTAAHAVLAAFASRGNDLFGDYEHQSLKTEENGKEAPASGWAKELQERADGIWGRVEWTPKAHKYIAEKEYRYLSPVFDHYPDGTVFRLSGWSLVNDPNLFLTALNRRGGLSFSSAHSTQGGTVELNELLERIRYMLNLPSLATPEEIVGELDKLKALVAQPETAAMRQALALPVAAGVQDIIRAAHGRVTGEPDPTKYVPRAEFERVAHAMADLQKQTKDDDVEKAVREAMANRKVGPTSADWARSYCRKDPQGFAQYVADAPVLLPGAESASHAATKPTPGKATENPLLADAKKRADKAAAKKPA